jgi:hypothetical protein
MKNVLAWVKEICGGRDAADDEGSARLHLGSVEGLTSV